MDHYSLFELNEYIRRIIALNFPTGLWISCEIAQVNESRGHYYFNLIEKDETDGAIIAQSEAVMWKRSYRSLRRKIGKEIDSLLQNGITVMLKVTVDFHERYGLKLTIEDIDPVYTMGKLELQRRETIATLHNGGLLSLNREKSLPKVIQRIAVISSATAAGYKDYQEQLAGNAYGYKFHSTLLPAAMQGQNAVAEITSQLEKIALRPDLYDCVVLTRGGGARLDLMAFDQLELCEKIAKCPIPVLVGIGHEVDETVTDLVAHKSLKTPTAVAAFIIENNLHFESELIDIGQWIQQTIGDRLTSQEQQLRDYEQLLSIQPQNVLLQNSRMLDYLAEELPRLITQQVGHASRNLNQIEQVVGLLNPVAVLARGYSLTMKDGRLVNSAKAVKKGDQLRTKFGDGEVESLVE